MLGNYTSRTQGLEFEAEPQTELLLLDEEAVQMSNASEVNSGGLRQRTRYACSCVDLGQCEMDGYVQDPFVLPWQDALCRRLGEFRCPLPWYNSSGSGTLDRSIVRYR